MRGRIILSLCDYTGNWAKPYADAGYDVRLVDIKRGEPAWVRCDCCENYLCRIHGEHACECGCPDIDEWEVSPCESGPGQDVRLMHLPTERVHGILCAPPCTVFANSGARWPRTDDEMREGLSIVDACLRIVTMCKPTWWALENPIGKLSRYLGKPAWRFDPCDFGALAEGNAYTKKTCLWGNFVVPMPLVLGKETAVTPVRVCSQGSWIQKLGGKSDRTKELRSATPMGFAKAFFISNP